MHGQTSRVNSILFVLYLLKRSFTNMKSKNQAYYQNTIKESIDKTWDTMNPFKSGLESD